MTEHLYRLTLRPSLIATPEMQAWLEGAERLLNEKMLQMHVDMMVTGTATMFIPAVSPETE